MDNDPLLIDPYQTAAGEGAYQNNLSPAGREEPAREGKGKENGKSRDEGKKAGDGQTRRLRSLHDRLCGDTEARRSDPTSV